MFAEFPRRTSCSRPQRRRAEKANKAPHDRRSRGPRTGSGETPFFHASVRFAAVMWLLLRGGAASAAGGYLHPVLGLDPLAGRQDRGLGGRRAGEQAVHQLGHGAA